MEEYKITAHYDKSVFLRFLKYLYFRGWRKLLLLVVLLPIVYSLIINGFWISTPFVLRDFLIGVVLPVAVLVLLYFFYISYRSRLLSQDPTYQQSHEYIITSEGLSYKAPNLEGSYKWDQLHKVLIGDDFLLFYTGRRRTLFIPMEDLGDQKEDILSLIKATMKK